jgi:hypothetical protein
MLDIQNPLTFQFGHPNFGTAKMELSLNLDPSGNGLLELRGKGPSGNEGIVQLGFTDGGRITVTVPENENTPFLLEQP